MSIFTPKVTQAYRFQLEKTLKEYFGEKYTSTDIMNYLFNHDYSGDFIVTYKHYPYEKRKIWQRLNLLWVWPLWIPLGFIKWILTGDMGVRKESAVGKVLVKLIGNY